RTPNTRDAGFQNPAAQKVEVFKKAFSQFFMKILNLVLAALFVLFAALQYNDPDPLRWAAMYVFVAGVCGFAAFGKYNKYVLWAGIAVCLVWLAVWLPEFLNWLDMGAPNIATSMKAETPYIEYTREFFGLLICLGVFGWQLLRAKKNSTH
ncbi:MAG: transmembrane 220 family protein, partial [Bacteroidota bacterium]